MVHMENYAENQYVSKCKNGRKVFLLQCIWRWTSAVLFTTLMICSLMEVGRSDVKYDHHFWKWFIYLTNWTLLVAVFQSWVAVGIVTKALKDKNHSHDTIEILQNSKSFWGFIYQMGYTIALVISLCSTVGYWVLVHDPSTLDTDFVILIGHGLTFLLMAVDAIILGHPIKMKDVVFNVIFFCAYTIFNLAYFLAGGVDRVLSYSMYPFMDWKQPQESAIYLVILVTLIVMAHLVFYGIHRLRNYINSKIWSPKNTKTTANFDVEKNNFKLTSKY